MNSEVIRDNWAWVYTFPSIRKTEAEWLWIQVWATQSSPDPKIPTNKTTNQYAQPPQTPSKMSIKDQGKRHEDPWQLYENSQCFRKKKTSLQTFIRKKTEVDQDDKMQQVQGKCLRIKQKFVV